jgi:hypothetical protein
MHYNEATKKSGKISNIPEKQPAFMCVLAWVHYAKPASNPNISDFYENNMIFLFKISFVAKNLLGL